MYRERERVTYLVFYAQSTNTVCIYIYRERERAREIIHVYKFVFHSLTVVFYFHRMCTVTYMCRHVIDNILSFSQDVMAHIYVQA